MTKLAQLWATTKQLHDAKPSALILNETHLSCIYKPSADAYSGISESDHLGYTAHTILAHSSGYLSYSVFNRTELIHYKIRRPPL